MKGIKKHVIEFYITDKNSCNTAKKADEKKFLYLECIGGNKFKFQRSKDKVW